MMAHVKSEERLHELLESFANDPDVLGVWLGGSRAKGYANLSSDFDVWVFLTEEAYAERQRLGAPRKCFDGPIEVYSTHLGELARHRSVASESLGIRYAVADTEPLLDKTGQLRHLIAELGSFPGDRQQELVTNALDAYCNAFLRSIKAERRGDRLAALLQAGQSIDRLLQALFALHARFAPFVEYLAHEVPLLDKVPWRDGLLDRLAAIAETADVTTQQGLERDVEHLFRQEGYSAVFEVWEQSAGSRWRESFEPA